MIEPKVAGNGSTGTRQAVIDAAVFNDVPSSRALFPYLPPYWVEHMENTLFKGPTEPYYPANAPIAARPGSRPPREDGEAPMVQRSGGVPSVGLPPASKLSLVREQVLDAAGV